MSYEHTRDRNKSYQPLITYANTKKLILEIFRTPAECEVIMKVVSILLHSGGVELVVPVFFISFCPILVNLLVKV